MGKKTKPDERGLTKRQRMLLDRVRAGHWYEAHREKTPKDMEVLVERGLVGIMGRVVSVKACYVPAGSKPLKVETLPPFQCNHFHTYWNRNPVTEQLTDRRCSLCGSIVEISEELIQETVSHFPPPEPIDSVMPPFAPRIFFKKKV